MHTHSAHHALFLLSCFPLPFPFAVPFTSSSFSLLHVCTVIHSQTIAFSFQGTQYACLCLIKIEFMYVNANGTVWMCTTTMLVLKALSVQACVCLSVSTCVCVRVWINVWAHAFNLIFISIDSMTLRFISHLDAISIIIRTHTHTHTTHPLMGIQG